ncbi:ferritin [Candidatus Woesearchaeota archaeon]|nr:ferritin [Candidatus Woesearchaeota archaeon]
MLHEDRSKLSGKTLDMKMAIESLEEEIEAVNAYGQRADACADENLRKILVHNSNEEKEHAAMLIEWLRQHDKGFEKELKDYLFSEKENIAGVEEKKH